MGLFGGNSESNNAQGQSGAAINSSGWAVGGSTAKGGGLSANSGGLGPLPWYGWASVAVVGWAIWRYRVKKRGK